MEKILTIVVPAYNAETCLRDNLESFCIESVLPDIEILVINDGSTDRTQEIAEEYVKQYPDSYRVITKKNGGHGSGINWGIRYASGVYFKVVDADDWVDREAFCRLVETLKRQDADVVYSGFLWTYDEGQNDREQYATRAEIPVPFEGVVYQKVYRFEDVSASLYMKMHSMTIRTDILRSHGIQIDEKCYYVDTEYITYPIPYVQTICFVEGYVYMYRIGRQGQSVGMEKMQQYEKHYDRVITSLLNFYGKLGTEIPCTAPKKRYIAGLIARVAAGKMKIMLSFPGNSRKKQELQMFDENLRNHYPDIYDGNINKAVWLLRKSRYSLYYPVSMMVRRRYR